MKKINFENLPSQNTPVNARNVNQLQSNVEEVFNGEEAMGSIRVEDIKSCNLLPISEHEAITLSKVYYFDEPLLAGTYRLSVESVASGGTNGIYLFHFSTVDGSEGLYIYLEDGNLAENITLTKEYNRVTVYSQNDWVNSRDITTIYNKTMLVRGNIELPYTPYKKFGYNDKESMGKIVVDDIDCKNLWSLNSLYSGTGHVLLDADINISPGTYTISFNKSVNSKVMFDFKNSSNQSTSIIFNDLEKQTVIFTNDQVKVAIYVYGDTDCTISNIQIEKGRVATEYTPYKNFDNTEDILYDDATGATNNIPLTNSSTNYKYLEIYYFKSKELGTFYTKVFNPNGREVGMSVNIPQENGAIQILTSRFYIGDNQITFVAGGYLNFWLDGSSKQFDFGQSNEIRITRVVGYK